MKDENYTEEFTRSDMWGVYAEDGDSGPMAIFRSKELAAEWLKWMHDRDELGCSFVILKTDIHASYWNSDGVWPLKYREGKFAP